MSVVSLVPCLGTKELWSWSQLLTLGLSGVASCHVHQQFHPPSPILRHLQRSPVPDRGWAHARGTHSARATV